MTDIAAQTLQMDLLHPGHPRQLRPLPPLLRVVRSPRLGRRPLLAHRLRRRPEVTLPRSSRQGTCGEDLRDSCVGSQGGGDHFREGGGSRRGEDV